MKLIHQHLFFILSLLIGLGSNSGFADEQGADQAFERGYQAYQAKDYELARQALKPLAEAGHAKAQIYMGALYEKGLGVERDVPQAMYWLELSAEQGGTKLQYDLGVRYLYGEDVRRDYNKVIYWWQKAADAGSSQAQYNLALMYIRGDGIEVDNEKAIKLFQLAVEQGLRDAQYALGLAYTLGQGVPLDYAKAHRLFKLAAEQDYPSAQYNLGALTESGEGTTANLQEAIVWYSKAAEQGHQQAQERLAQLQVPPVKTEVKNTPAPDVIHDQVWIKNQPASHYTIQISSNHNEEALVRWLQSLKPLAPLAYYPQQQNGKVVYKAIYGSFVDQAAAQKALSQMPEELVKLKPWLRKFSGVHGQILDD